MFSLVLLALGLYRTDQGGFFHLADALRKITRHHGQV